ncbi:aminotransferase class V-fold PLP-dependent enzyme [Georgenia yuyongxinii]
MSEAPGGRRTSSVSELRADCASCFGLCCVALPLTASADFAIDKAAGEPCRHLQRDFRCGIHSRLRQEGFPGCTVYDCFGAGQHVSQVTFGGRSWREDPGTAGQMFEVFPVVRQLHEMLVYLTEALTLVPARPLRGELSRVLHDVERLTAAGPEELLALDVAAHRAVVGALLGRTSELVRADARGDRPAAGRRSGRSAVPRVDLRGADRIGVNLRGADLRGADLRGAYLIGADLTGADLRVADLLGADLRGAHLAGADLTGCIFLTQPQLNAAQGDGATRLPPSFIRPAHWDTGGEGAPRHRQGPPTAGGRQQPDRRRPTAPYCGMDWPSQEYDAPLDRAHAHVRTWLGTLADRPVPPQADIAELVAALGPDLPEHPTPAADVVDHLAAVADAGLTAMPSGRFFGFVIGGTLPAALAADWLVSAWDQNSGLRRLTPAHSALEDLAAVWVRQVLGLPAESAVGFVTGGTMANFTCLAAARDEVLRRAGWPVAERGLSGAPRLRVLVGAERHDTIDLALRYLGLVAPEAVAADDQGRLRPAALAAALDADPAGPAIVCLQAGNVHSGAFDPFAEAIEIAHRHGAWVHVDGAFGLWAAASPATRPLLDGHDRADSWATDAHKTLNVPYDCGIAVVRDRAALRAAMGMHAAYLIADDAGDPLDTVPELSRRARAVPVWAALRSLGRSGTSELVGRFCRHARTFADGLASMDGVEVLNDVVFTQVCATFGDDERTRRVVDGLLEDGTAWMTGSRWHGRDVLRISVSNWSTSAGDVERSLAAVRRVLARV